MIDTKSWGEFKISDIFITNKHGKVLKVPTGAAVSKNKLKDGNIPRVTVSNFNNGITGYYADSDDKDYRVYNNFISVSFLGTVFYQPGVTSLDMKVHCLKPLEYVLNEYSAGYIVSIIRKTIMNFAYSDQLSSEVLAELRISLPITIDGQPDWAYMESYMKKIMEESEKSLENLKESNCDNRSIDTRNWKNYMLGDLFIIHPTKAYKLTNTKLLDGGGNPVVANSAYNNGIGGYSTQNPTEKGNMVTFSDTVDANTIFYQSKDFIGYPHVQGLYPTQYVNNWNEYTYQFFVSVFRKVAIAKGFDYGNKFRRDIATNLTVKLPVTVDGKPDWEYMESYMKKVIDKSEQAISTLRAVV